MQVNLKHTQMEPKNFWLQKVLGSKIWNNLPHYVKSSDNLDTFKHLLKNLDGNLCKCNLCKNDIF